MEILKQLNSKNMVPLTKKQEQLLRAIHPLDWEEIEEVEREELASSFYNWLSNSYSIAEKHLKINVDSPVYWLD
jgi:hypothetical protein